MRRKGRSGRVAISQVSVNRRLSAAVPDAGEPVGLRGVEDGAGEGSDGHKG